jgi:hypothetical protein
LKRQFNVSGTIVLGTWSKTLSFFSSQAVPANLRPMLQARRFQADRDKLLAINLGPLGAYWGGEYAAEQLTHYLKTERFTVYLTGPPPPALLTGAGKQRQVGEGEVVR